MNMRVTMIFEDMVVMMMMMKRKPTVCFVQQEISSDEFFEAPVLALHKPAENLKVKSAQKDSKLLQIIA